ncbi:hypothetical protein DPMN_075623 [Dreissena polymorpha]|uniref:Ig-like domain-containing protein n=1 Tax=Dreissena polymorpha TaxID=45954 RepID=A0A9D3YLF6_DREPO|nr:hypothetical protein DPMN_075623 [Dreissena polymorpha]
MRMFCCGNECPKEVVLDPQGAVTTKGSKVKFACSISQCVTTHYPDTKFQMAHNGTEFGEATKTHESKDDKSFAYFEKQFNSPSDAGTYTCKVTPDEQQPAQSSSTSLIVEFLPAEDKPTFVRLNNGTNPISCLRDFSDSQDLVMAWDDRRTSCDRSENTKTV